MLQTETLDQGVMDRKEILIFYGFDRQNVFVIRFFSFQCR